MNNDIKKVIKEMEQMAGTSDYPDDYEYGYREGVNEFIARLELLEQKDVTVQELEEEIKSFHEDAAGESI